MRIATSTINAIGVAGMANQTSQMVTLEEEISTNRTVNLAGDNPVAAAESVQVQTSIQNQTQYTANQDSATTALGLEDSTLSSVSTVIQNIQSVLEQANNGSLTDTDRASYATELESDRAQLLALANTTNSTGQYIFSGAQTSTAPFSNNPSGAGVVYNGDQGVINAQISSSRQIATNDPGSNVFMSATPGATSPIPTASSSNTGSGTIGVVSTTQSGAASNADSYTVTFAVDASGNTTYTVTDNSATPPTVSSAQNYTAGSSIQLGTGETITINGAPADGDSFNVAPPTASQNNIFATIDNAIAALQTPSQSASGQTNVTNQMATALSQVANSYTTVLTTLASVGSRETEVNATSTLTSTVSTTYSTQLSNLVGLTTDAMAGVYSQLSTIQTQLQATEEAYSSTAKLSLFSDINT
ncbi:flagellar hook-associated protein FlgL [Pararobbsia silviterrae]|uniref:Flagellar hook-associated protein 3 n=1 Tax=Pararobbsia silviterrae TaxID=1792498 RepID=A0A494XA91_9BURK|nr:flagellar hook-associated protein FlgL [Pararobbsia silviterrae]RKP45356.1 flagellar hook-associated protein 3 [Pararobbsia silviterrae]